MGHGFRFSPDKRSLLAKSQMAFCQIEEPFPDCISQCYCSRIVRWCCMFWDIFNVNSVYCNKEMKKQKRLDDWR